MATSVAGRRNRYTKSYEYFLFVGLGGCEGQFLVITPLLVGVPRLPRTVALCDDSDSLC